MLFASLTLVSRMVMGAATNNIPSPIKIPKPAWRPEASLAVKESYDDNIFASGVAGKFLPAYTVPPGSVAALENRSSWVTMVSPKLTLNFAPWLGDGNFFQILSLGYAPDFVTYHDQDSESYQAHRVIAALKGKAGSWSLGADNNFVFIHGAKFGPTYPGPLFNAYASPFPRERREQIQDRAAVTLQDDWRNFFFRPAAALIYYDLMTAQLNIPGYQNYEDRYDVNGGVDLGYELTPSFALTLGYRYGHQYQQQFAFSPYSSSSDYQRMLAGLEGKPWRWLEVEIQVGPDFRNYPENSATHLTPINDLHPVKFYGEGSLTATITTKDTVTFKFKEWQWLSSLGKVPYYDSTVDLAYHRRLTEKLGFDLDGKLLSADYTSGNLAACHRKDLDYNIGTGLGYILNPHVSFSLAYTLDLGRNNVDSVVNESTRAFSRNLIAIGALMSF